MNLFEPSQEVLDKEVDVAEIAPRELEETMGASAYTGDYGRAMELIKQTDNEVVELQDLCDRIFRKSRFSRIYVDNEEHGYPYLSPTNVGSLKPWYREINNTEKAFVARKKHDISEYSVEDGWILITCSGSVNLGSVFLATEFLSDYFLTHDMIRVVPQEDTLEGYLYAYLDSWVGRAIILHNEFGIGVDHIEPHQLEELPIILPPREERKNIHEKIHQRIREAYDARERFMKKNKKAVERVNKIFDNNLGNDYEPV